MPVHHREFRISTRGEGEMHDLTDKVATLVGECEIADGVVVVFVPGSTAGLTTIEFEPGLIQDFPPAMERLAPRQMNYAHDERWHDGNGHSHVRASLLGPSLTVPFVDGELTLGTWQQIIYIDFDNRPRQRKLILQLVGE